jgi:ornithine decarboxylase
MSSTNFPELVNFIQECDVKLFEEGCNSIIDVIGKFIENNDDDSAFYIVNIKKIVEQYEKWTEHLPRVKPFYAVKCNPNPVITKLLNGFNIGFDCASKNEISQIISQGTKPEDVIFANPCKASGQIKFARSEDVDLMTFDDVHELYKIKLYHPHAKLVLRIAVDESKSMCKFNCKFGATPSEIKNILNIAKSLELNIVGVSFHVGSNCLDAKTYYTALEDVKKVFTMASENGFAFELVDIGGGFPGYDKEGGITFEEIAEQINKGIDDFFPEEGIEFIAEPGRYFVCSSHTLVTNIIGKKKLGDKFTYYLNDGIYGSFNCVYFDNAKPVIMPYNERDGKQYESTVFGPTCDSIDIISESCQLPDLAIGEWVYVENFGAYTIAAASTFNGFQQTRCVYCFV